MSFSHMLDVISHTLSPPYFNRTMEPLQCYTSWLALMYPEPAPLTHTKISLHCHGPLSNKTSVTKPSA